MKKILSLSVMALLLMGLVGGGTWAYFSDTESASGNELVAGTLDLGLSANQIDSEDPLPTTGIISGVTTPTNWAPGDPTFTYTLYLHNSGTIKMEEVTMKLSNGQLDTDDRPNNITPGAPYNDVKDDFRKMVTVKSAKLDGVDLTTNIVNSTLDDLASGSEAILGSLNAGGSAKLEIEFEFSATATNGCQGNKYEFDLTFTGYQKANQNATP